MTTKTRIKITIHSGIRLNFEIYILDLYALKKYKQYYWQCIEIKEYKKINLVDRDIKILTEKYNITKVADVRLLLLAQLLPVKEKNKFLNEYVG